MTYTPIIVPINNTKQVNCIIENNVRYCETKHVPSEEIGSAVLALAIYLIYAVVCARVSSWLYEITGSDMLISYLFLVIILPLLVIGVILKY